MVLHERRARWVATAWLAASFALSGTASAQRAAPTGDELAALLPARIGSAPRTDATAYTRFATASYALAGGASATVQLHEVVGEGVEAYQRASCPSVVVLAAREACVRPGVVSTTVSWVLDDAIRVSLGAPDEARARALAQSLDLAPYVRLAASLRSRPAEAPAVERRAEADEREEDEPGIVADAAPPPSTPAAPTPRPRVVSIPRLVLPEEARARAIEGSVLVFADVAADGSLTRARVVRTEHEILNEAALACVRGARFEPARDAGGRAVAASAVVRVLFSLD
jgi:TonB family protein